jgi:hypothetical protein
MWKQGYSLGKQLAIWMPDLAQIAKENPGRVWFMGRDMDVFYIALAERGLKVRYIAGLNRDNASKLAHRGKLEGWLRSIGVRDEDILIDSGYRGSIFQRVAESTKLDLYFLLLTADPEGATGYAVSDDFNTPKHRNIILALEHSPKREVVTWDEKKRRPRVHRTGGADGQRATAFLRGCVQALKEAV